MVIIQEKTFIMPDSSEEISKCAEIYDCSSFFIPAEIIACEEKIAW